MDSDSYNRKVNNVSQVLCLFASSLLENKKNMVGKTKMMPRSPVPEKYIGKWKVECFFPNKNGRMEVLYWTEGFCAIVFYVTEQF